MISESDAKRIAQEGMAALQRGDSSAARAAFEQLANSGAGGPQARFLLAEACRRQFYEREQFPWVHELEEATAEIQAELIALLDEGAELRPYVEQDKDRPFYGFHGLNDDPSALYLRDHGSLMEENAARCPRTIAAIQKCR